MKAWTLRMYSASLLAPKSPPFLVNWYWAFSWAECLRLAAHIGLPSTCGTGASRGSPALAWVDVAGMPPAAFWAPGAMADGLSPQPESIRASATAAPDKSTVLMVVSRVTGGEDAFMEQTKNNPRGLSRGRLSVYERRAFFERATGGRETGAVDRGGRDRGLQGAGARSSASQGRRRGPPDPHRRRRPIRHPALSGGPGRGQDPRRSVLADRGGGDGPHRAFKVRRPGGGGAGHRRSDGQGGRRPRRRSRLHDAAGDGQAGADGSGDECAHVAAPGDAAQSGDARSRWSGLHRPRRRGHGLRRVRPRPDGRARRLSLIHISEPTRQAEIS